MDKIKMAHDCALAYIEYGDGKTHYKDVVEFAWKYADAMQAEADKRVNKERPDVFLTKDKDGKCLHFHHEFGHKNCMDCGASLEEWQPDWSQAPAWANWWAIRQDSSDALWCVNKPTVTEDCFLSHGGCGVAPSFNYQGNWQNSLRKRPQ